ncbi:MAG: putative chaperonin 10 Kd subunit [Prokaryotic dsDNA virus sp.]|jgi:co-chaperonin GroES (HSP10)|nr:MAG: putative chaperonin 10 Kd subunit [Prokaryotic dsDNA virus sp.]|tara:strand:- start:3220 stop:3477 length:258 start_codon:yes stop_codon:yes gene_type:complete
MKPIGKYIVINEIKEEVKTQSGILLSGDDVDKIRYKKGTVVKPGTEVTKINEGDVIYYDTRAGYSMFIEDVQYTIIRENDVVVVL